MNLYQVVTTARLPNRTGSTLSGISVDFPTDHTGQNVVHLGLGLDVETALLERLKCEINLFFVTCVDWGGSCVKEAQHRVVLISAVRLAI